MPSTQLTCPHCSSTLNFGADIAAGTSVECLICMQTFAAAPEVISAALPSRVAADRPADALAAAVTTKPEPKKPSFVQTSAPRLRRPSKASTDGGKIVLLAFACGLSLLLAAGIGVTIWKVNSAVRTGTGDDPTDPSLVLDPNIDPNENPGKPANPPPTKSAANKGPAQPAPDDDEDTAKLKLLEKKLLVRKTPSTGGANDVDWQPTFNVKEQQEIYRGLSQKSINLAIEKGVGYLKKNQNADGTWASGHAVGHASIGGLTLLECQTPASDAVVQRAAQHVRANAAAQNWNYELSLAILFLDRLGDPRDRPLIQGMALRLLAAQNDCGGWSYHCPLLDAQDMFQLYAFLKTNKQPSFLNPIVDEPKKSSSFAMPNSRDPGRANDAFMQFEALVRNQGLGGAVVDPKRPAPKSMTPIRREWLKPDLRDLPIVKNQGKGKGQQVSRQGHGDNSNTQFALLALWAARRHDVPTEQALLGGFQRFATSQNSDGTWGYSLGGNAHANTMTCVGLLGMAMGHGAAPEIVKFDAKNPKDSIVKPALDDPKIKRGLKALAPYIGKPIVKGDTGQLAMENLYMLWSIERVAMLYDLKTIEGKEWYPWGAQILLHHQQTDGQWPNSNYHGANPPLNTCFALLFLRRSNLVQDLTQNLRLYTGIRYPEK